MTTLFDPIEEAIAAIARGEIVVVADDEYRENEGDLIMAADAATPEAIAFFVRHTSGVICVGLTGERCDDLGLTPMVVATRTPSRTAPHSPSPSTSPRARRPASRPRTARRHCEHSPTPPSVRTRSTGPGTSSRCGPGPAGC